MPAASEERTEQSGRVESTQGAASPNLARSSAIMFAGTLVSRVLGLVRSPILLGAVVGISAPAANGFDIANKLPNLIYMVVVGGLVNAVLVPAIVRATKRSTDGGIAFINKLLTVAIVTLGIATALITLSAPLIVKGFAATMQDDWYRLTVAFAYWCLPQIFFYGMYTVLGQILNARENFGPYMWAPALNNVVAIGGFLVVLATFGAAVPADVTDISRWSAGRVAMIGGFSTLGIALQALILVVPLRALGIRFRPDFAWRNSGLGEAGRASWWMLLMMVTGIVPTLVLSNVAAGATQRAEDAGIALQSVAGNAIYTAAYSVYSIPTSLITVSIATAIFTRLAKAAADADLHSISAYASLAIRAISTLTFLSAAGLIVLSVPVMRIFSFTVSAEESVTLARVLTAMCIGLVSIGIVTTLDRVYYAFGDTRGAFWINLPFQVCGMIGYLLCGWLPPQWTVIGIGLVMSLTNTAAAVVMFTCLARRYGGLEKDRVVGAIAKLAVITLVTIGVGFALLLLFGPLYAPITVAGAVLRIVVVGPVMVGCYVGGMMLAKMPEIEAFSRLIGSVRAKLAR
ncbi:murein biosynthesis integral membrane protein MurJ [Trueperella sp. HMSC08B05]|nr:lipid II flippase MurJ [Trueperella sp. HMSC08B05]